MLNDVVRNEAFQAAIERRVEDGDRVVDIGTGTGLLSILAARAGARSVDAFEAHPQMADVAASTIAATGIGERIALHRTLSANVAFEDDDRRNVLVTEVFDCALIGEGIVPTLRHARAALLADGYKAIPQTATLHGALVASPRIRGLNEVSRACGVDVSHLNHLQTRGHFPVRLRTWPHALVSREETLYHLDLREEPPAESSWDVVFEPSEAAVADGVVAWFSMDLGLDGPCSTHPEVESHWMQAFMPFPRPVRVSPDDALPVRLTIEDEVRLLATPHEREPADARPGAGRPTSDERRVGSTR